ncbi:MAG: SPOR domain-containing protein [Holophagales bacterium]|jgi:cell division protein FtsN|nr:SPOR domain-containing protein [Holophagales bacterium]
MAERESQFITMSRQGIFVTTAIGVGLLTFSYVIGVQVGKRSLTQKSVRAKTLDEELTELPEPLDEQLKLFRSMESATPPRRNDRQRSEAASPGAGRGATASNAPGPAATTASAASAIPAAAVSGASGQAVNTDKYTAQVIATGSAEAANRVSEHLKTAGYSSKVVLVDGLYKVQLDWSLTRAELDARAPRLKSLGYEPLAVKIQ